MKRRCRHRWWKSPTGKIICWDCLKVKKRVYVAHEEEADLAQVQLPLLRQANQ